MIENLVIVESPAKAKTIRKYLGGGYEVTASMGHIRDLPQSQLGIDVACDARQFRHRIEALRRGPRLDPGAAPVGADQTDRNVEFLEKFTAEEEAGGGEAPADDE